MSQQDKDAEKLYEEAFYRLVALGKTVSQNEVAREAGRDPSALRKGRYPAVIIKIQNYVAEQNERKAIKKNSKDNRTRSSKEKIYDYKNQINKLCSIVAAQNSKIEDLMIEIENLKSGVVRLPR